MTIAPGYLHKMVNNEAKFCIKLLSGTQVQITHVGDVQLCNDLTLKGTLVVPEFKYNLLLLRKLCKANKCMAIFRDEVYLI